MLEDEILLRKRILELAEKSYRSGRYLFTGFLSPGEQSVCIDALTQNGFLQYDSFGGTDMAERAVIRLGSEEEMGYAGDYPISCILIEPNLAKFAEELSHRDYLGSILNLGIEREVIGDIIIRDKKGYVICLSRMAAYIAENLTKIKHTYVKCKVTEEMPEALAPVLENYILSVSSERCDIVISKLYNISRNDSLNLFRGKRVCINSRIEESGSRNLKEGDVVSTRGFGKFLYHGVQSVNKKEKLRISVDKYI